MIPEDYIKWLDSEIKEAKQQEAGSRRYSPSKRLWKIRASILLEARNSFITIQFPSQEEDNPENNFTHGLE
jgi:hypothetical protein